MGSKRRITPWTIDIYKSMTPLLLLSMLALISTTLFFMLAFNFHVSFIATSSFPLRGLVRPWFPLSSTIKLSKHVEFVQEECNNNDVEHTGHLDDIQLRSIIFSEELDRVIEKFGKELPQAVLVAHMKAGNVIHRRFSNGQMPTLIGCGNQESVASKDSFEQLMSLVQGMNRKWARIGKGVDEDDEDKCLVALHVIQDVKKSETKKATSKGILETRRKMPKKNSSRVKSAKVVKTLTSMHFSEKILKHAASNTPPENTTLMDRLLWLKMNRPSFKILQSDSLSAQFSRRMSAFLTGQPRWRRRETRMTVPRGIRNLKKVDAGRTGAESKDENEFEVDTEILQHKFRYFDSGPCKVRFFMTWISSSLSFGPREHLSLESVFKTHPSACLVIISRTLDSQQGKQLLQPFIEKGFRVIAIAPNLPYLLRDTPALRWFEDLKKGKIDPGSISFGQNLSNLLRLAVLYRYGGIYIDSDVILLNDVSYLSNAIGAQSVDRETGEWKRLNNAVMAFNRKHPLLLKFIQEFSLTFNGSKWGHNGPYLVSRVVRRLSTHPNYVCKVLPPLSFYPVDWEHISSFFHVSRDESEQKWQVLKLQHLQERSLAIHMWNKQSRHLEIEPTSIMDEIFQHICVFCNLKILRAALQPQA